MQTILSIIVNANGNLEITATPEGIEYLQDQIGDTRTLGDPASEPTWKQTPMGMWSDMLESYSCNGSYNLAPDNTFALTEAPIIASEPIILESEDQVNDPEWVPQYHPETKFWAFADYMVVDEFEKLLNGETVTFIAVPEDRSVTIETRADITEERLIVLCHSYNDKDFSTYTESEIEGELERRRVKREMLEAKILTPSQQLQFILKNDPDNEKYDIEKIFQSSFCRALSKQLPYTHFSNGTNYLFTKYRVDYTNTVKQEATRFEAYITSTMKLSIADFTLYYYCKSPMRTYWLRYSEDNAPAKPAKDTLYFSMSADGYTDLCHLVMYLVDRKYLPTYKETNDFLDQQVPKICYSNKTAYQYTYGNITVKRFANGRLDIKGMTADQVTLLNKLFALHEKLRNI